MITIINEKYEGIKSRKDGRYEIDSIIDVDEDVRIEINLYVSKSMKVGGSLKVGKSLEVGGWLVVDGPLKVGGSLKVGKSLDVCGMLRVGGDIIYRGIKSKTILLITSRYLITILDTHIKIGCEFHVKDAWRNFTDRELLKMAADKEDVKWFKKNKRAILNFSIK